MFLDLETILVCEKGIFEIKTISNLLVPHNNKPILALKPQTIPKKTRMYFINYHKTNHNVETCSVKRKEEFVLAASEVTTQHIKIQRLVRYSYHIYGDIRHKIIDCLKYSDM